MNMQSKKYVIALVTLGFFATIGILYVLWAPVLSEKVPSLSGKDSGYRSPIEDAVHVPVDPGKSLAIEPKTSSDNNASGGGLSQYPQDPTEEGGQNGGVVPAPPQDKAVKTSPAISEEEMFVKLWPPGYQEFILTTQQMMARDSFPNSFSVKKVSKDSEVYAALEEILEYALSKGWVPKEDAENLRKGIREELPRLINQEREVLRSTGAFSADVVPGRQRFLFLPVAKDGLISTLVDGLKYVFSARTAYASWVTTGDCYKDDAPGYPVMGFNAWDFCCNCGLYCIAYYCEFVPDCGPHSVSCNVPLGCLNLICQGWPNAIWDAVYYPGTGICGCG